MIADRLRALVAELRAQADHEQQALEHFIAHAPIVNCDAVVAALRERLAIADRLDQILAEDAGGSEEPDCHAYSRNSRTEEGAALWMIAHTLRQIRDRLPSPPPQEPQP